MVREGALPEDRRGPMESLRRAIRAAAADAIEAIAYNMPAFRTAGGRFLVSYDAYKAHYSLFPFTDEMVAAFGEELADPAGDVVAATLVTATTRQTSQLVPLLGELARSTREVARMHERVTAARASTFQAVRTITAAVLGFVGLLVVELPQEVVSRLVDLAASPGAEVTIDLETSTLTLPTGAAVRFPIEHFARYCLTNGVDELGFLLGREAQIAAYEQQRGLA